MSQRNRVTCAAVALVIAVFLAAPAPTLAERLPAGRLPLAAAWEQVWSWLASLVLPGSGASPGLTARWEKEGSAINPDGQPKIPTYFKDGTSNTILFGEKYADCWSNAMVPLGALAGNPNLFSDGGSLWAYDNLDGPGDSPDWFGPGPIRPCTFVASTNWSRLMPRFRSAWPVIISERPA